MRDEQYTYIYQHLNKYSDISYLSKKLNLKRELLLVIYTQKTIRNASKDYYKMKHRLEEFKKLYKNGTTFVQIAEKNNFPPVLLALMLCQDMGLSKKAYRKMLEDPKSIKDQRLKKELEKVNKADKIYSPRGSEVQRKRGVVGELKLEEWLQDKGIRYKTEEDLRGEYPKTPDILLDKPMFHRGSMIKWIESKASFGDKIEIRKNLKGQLVPYSELFGEGMVIYWFGTVDSAPIVDGVLIETEEFLKHYDEDGER